MTERARAQVRERPLGEEERRPHVRVPLTVEALRRRLGERHRLEDAGGVDEDVDPSEGVDSRADDRSRAHRPH